MPYTAPDIINVSAGTTSNNLSNLTFSNSNGVTFGLNASTITASHNGLTSQSNQAVSAANGSSTFQTLSFANSNGVSFSTGTQGLFASHNGLTSQSNQAFDAGGVSSAFQTLVLQDSNGVSFSNNAGSVRVTHGLQFTSNTSNITSNALNTSVSRVINIVAATNNTGGGTASLSSNVSFSNANGATFYTSAGGAVVLSYTVPAGGGVAISGGANSQSTGTVNFANSNGITFGLSNNGTMTASHNGLTTAAQSNQVVNSLNGSTGQISLNVGSSLSASTNGSSITFGLASNITTALQSAGAYLTTARASNDAIGLNTAQTNVTWTVNSSGLSLNAAGYAGTATTFNGANISGSITLNSNGLNLSLSGATAAPSPVNISAGTTSNNLGTIVFSNSNGVSFGLNGSTITASVNAGGGIAAAAGSQTGTSGTILFQNSNNITFGMSDSSVITASFNPINVGISNLGNTAGTSGTFDGANLQYVFAGGNNITLSQSSNGSSVTLSIVGGGTPLQHYSPPWGYSGMATNSSIGNSTLYFQPFDIQEPVYGSRINFYISLSGSLSAANSTGSCSVGAGYALYTMNGTAAESRTLSRLTSYSMTLIRQSMNSNTQYNATHYIGLQDITSHSTSQVGISNANASTYQATSVNGLRAVAFPLNSTLTPGRYWLGFSVQTTAGNAMTNNVSVAITSVGVQPHIAAWGVNSSATNASVFRNMQGWGTYSAQSGAWPDTIAFTTDAIRAAVAQTLIHFDIKGYSTSTNVL
jgi:hypothetical protein